MKKIIDFIQPFNEFELEVNEFNLRIITVKIFGILSRNRIIKGYIFL
jgi:hypothetical protein